jgi:hypothetical protein
MWRNGDDGQPSWKNVGLAARVTVDMATVRRRMERALISRRTKDAEQRIARRLDCPHSRHFPMKALTGRVNPKVLCARALA